MENLLKPCRFYTRVNICRDQQLTYFCGNAIECRQIGNPTALQMAKFNADTKYHVIGVLEDVNKTLSVLQRKLPNFFGTIKQLSVEKKNRNEHPKPSVAARRKLESQMALEIEFYEFVRAKLNKQFSKT